MSINSCARHETVYMIMKKMIFGLTVVMIMVAAVATFANVVNDIKEGQGFFSETSHLATQGTHCSGTVGCGCTGFAPITNGDVWQQAYCRHCGHKRSVHR